MTKLNPVHAAARKRVACQVKALYGMLRESCCGNTYHSGYLGSDVGEIIGIKRFGNNIHITIDSFDEPPERSILRLQPVNIQENSQ
jgi:hypothetical protein